MAIPNARVRAIAFLIAATTINSACAQIGANQLGQAGAPVSARELVEVRGLSGLSISPDAQYAAIRVDHADIDANRTLLQWNVIRLRDGTVAQIADGGLPRRTVNGNLATEHPQWSPDNAWIYFRRVQDEQLQLWRVKRDGRDLHQLTHDASDVEAFIVDAAGAVHYAVGPGTRAEIKAAEQGENDNGVLLDGTFIEGFAATQNFELNGRWATVRLNPRALNFGRATLLGETPLRAFSMSHDFLTTTPASDVVSQQFDSLWEASGGGSLAFDPRVESRAIALSNRVAELLKPDASTGKNSLSPRSGRLLSWKAATGASVACESPACLDTDRLALVGWSSAGDRLIFQTQTFGVVRLNVWDVARKTVKPLFETDGVLGDSDSGIRGACQLAGAEAICILAEPDNPPKLVAIDIRTGNWRLLLDPNPTMTASRLGASKTITLADRFGSSTVGRLVLPRGYKVGERLPLVISSYTCDGFLLGGSGHDVPEHVLAGLGFAAVCVDASLSKIRRGPGLDLQFERTNQSALDFFEDTVRVLDRQGVVDPQRVMVTGFSGSATSTTYAISHSNVFTAAAVMTQGSLDAINCYLTAHYRSCADLARKEGHGLPYDSRAGLLSISPAWNAERITTPLLMQLPETEYTGLMQLWGAMTDYGRAVEMHIFADANHYKYQPRQRLSVYKRNLDWAQFWLRGVESADAARAGQNLRWKDLRDKQCRLFTGENALPDAPWYCSRT